MGESREGAHEEKNTISVMMQSSSEETLCRNHWDEEKPKLKPKGKLGAPMARQYEKLEDTCLMRNGDM